MLHKVFLVEDEIVTREGIRDNVDWHAAGFAFCGEAPDGEIALPLIEAYRPDLLITDIKMPFMDGLQLCRIVRERLPAVKIVILSGHDEFQFAQEAIKLGVSEYLLKPVSVRDLHALLERMAAQLAQEQKHRANLQLLQDQVEQNLSLLRERFLLRVISGGTTTTEAVEQGLRLGIDIVAPAYLVVAAKLIPQLGGVQPFDYSSCIRAWETVTQAVAANGDVFVVQKDLDEMLLLLKGDSAAEVADRAQRIIERIQAAATQLASCRLRTVMGAPLQRLTEIQHSLAAALQQLQGETRRDLQDAVADEAAGAELLRLDRSIVDTYLRFGEVDGFDAMFEAFAAPLSPSARSAHLIKSYLYLELVLAAAHFVLQLGGDVEAVMPELRELGLRAQSVRSAQQLSEEMLAVYGKVLAFRNQQAGKRSPTVIQRARDFIDQHFCEPDLSLQQAAEHVHLSANHFSAVFSGAAGETFKEYVTRLRIDRAKELLRTTSLGAAEICYAVGYSDPHYFSAAFKRATGMSPRHYRSPSATDGEERSAEL